MARTTARLAQAKKAAFLREYEKQGTLLAAAQVVGISPRRHYEWLEKSESYRKAFEEAEEKSIQRLEAECIRRAVEGTQENVYHNGQVVGTNRRYSDVLLIFLMKSKRPEVYRERLDARFQANLNVASAVKVIHEYHDAPSVAEAITTELEPTARLLTASIPDAVTTPDDENN